MNEKIKDLINYLGKNNPQRVLIWDNNLNVLDYDGIWNVKAKWYGGDKTIDYWLNGLNKFDTIYVNNIGHEGLIYKLFDHLSDDGCIILNNYNKQLPDAIESFRENRNSYIYHILLGENDGVYIITKSKYKSEKVHYIYWDEFLYGNSEDDVVCCIAKMEKDFIKDWVEYHLRIGFDKVYIYDNNDDNEYYDELLRGLIKQNKVRIIDARGLKGVQISKYKEFYKEYRFHWCAYIDCDEYIWFKENGKFNNIKDFINSQKDSDIYELRWVCYKGVDKLDLNEPIYTQCITPIDDYTRKFGNTYPLNHWVKSIVRSGLGDIDCTEHNFWCNGKELNIYKGGLYKEPLDVEIIRDIKDDDVYIKHFIIRDIDSYFQKKIKRGHAGTAWGDSKDENYIPLHAWMHNWQHFVDIQHVLSDYQQQYLIKKGYQCTYQFKPQVILLLHMSSFNNNDEFYNRIYDYVIKLEENTNLECIIMKSSPSQSLEEKFDIFGYFHHYICSYMDLDNIPIYDIINYDESQQNSIVVKLSADNSIGDHIYNDEYFKKHIDPILDIDNFIRICHEIIEKDENENFIYVPKDSIIYDEGEAGYSQTIDDFYKGDLVMRRRQRIQSNTFITNLSTYKKMRDEYYRWTKIYGQMYDNDIINSHNDMYTNTYDAMNYLWLNVVDDIITL